MKIDSKLEKLPLTKSKADTLESLFGSDDVVPMWVADMEFEVAKPIQEALVERIANSGFGYEYKPASFFSAQKDWYFDRYEVDLDREHLVFSPSITTTLAVLIESFTSQNDGVIIQPPVFMEFRNVIRRTKRKVVKNPLKLVDGNYYEIDFEQLEEVSRSDNNKILILCNPHNPVGRVWRKEELERLVSICKENNLLLVSDEIHKDIILFDNQFTSVLKYVASWDSIVVCTSEAKTFNLCGISDSMAIVPNENIRKALKNNFAKYNLGRTNALTRVALEAAYLNGNLWLSNLIKTIENNIHIIERELLGSRIKLVKPEGTYQVWLDFGEIFDDTKKMFKHLTEFSKIGLNAGHWFGREGAMFMRMNIATSSEKVQDAIKRIIKATS